MIKGLTKEIYIPINPMGKRKSYGDCRLILFSHLLKYYGYKYNESDILGVSSALDFQLFKFKINEHDCFGIMGRDLNAEVNFCKKVGVGCVRHVIDYNSQSLVDEDVIKDILINLKSNYPVIAVVDRFFLKYLTTINPAHFPFHTIIIIGYNYERKVFKVIDAMAEGVNELPLEIFLKAMFETNMIKKEAKGIWYEIRPNNYTKTSQRLINYEEAIKKQVSIFLKDDGPIAVINQLADFLDNLSRKVNIEENNVYVSYLKFQIPLIYKMIFEQEFSCSLYRKLYLDFLLSAFSEKISKKSKINSIKRLFVKDIKKWTAIASKMHSNRKLKINQVKEFSKALREIGKTELMIFEEINRTLM